MLPIAEMAVFARVVDAGSFSAAADRMGLSKSAVSAQVLRLEAEIGVRLLNRTTRKLSLTEAGAACYRHCARVLAEAEAAEAAATALHTQPRGTLRISAPDSFGWMHVAPSLTEFMARYPEIHIDLVLSAQHMDLIENRLDLAIRIGSLPDSGLVTRRLAESKLVVCASPAYLERRGTPSHPRDLMVHDSLRFTPLGWGEEWRFLGPEGPVRFPIRPALSSDSGEVLREVALAGGGIALLPTWMVHDQLRARALVPLLTDWAPPSPPIQAVYLSNRQTAAKVQVFVDYLAKRFGRVAYWDRGLKL